MKLTDLDASFVRDGGDSLPQEDNFSSADGLLFDCPVCKNRNAHSLLVWFEGRGASPAAVPLPRWKAYGTCLDDLSLFPSVNAQSEYNPQCWHGFVSHGEIQ